MTARTLTGTYSAGYSLKAAYSTVTLNKTALVGGSGLSTGANVTTNNFGKIQATSGTGLVMGANASVYDAPGALMVGASQAIVARYGLTGYNGYDGVVFTSSASMNNRGEVFGGAGGLGGPGYKGGIYGGPIGGGTGGAAGAGVYLTSGTLVNNGGVVEGGTGGHGGATGNYYGGARFGGNGGAGGAGVILAGVGSIRNIGGDLYGGFGGAGGAGGIPGNGGLGGAAVVLQTGGYLYTHGGIVLGGYGGVSSVEAGGAGAAAVLSKSNATIVADGLIRGGAGWASGKYSEGGFGGAGVSMTSFGTVTVLSLGTISGGAGAKGAVGGDGGDGIFQISEGIVVNAGGVIRGGASGTGGTGVYGSSDTGGAGVWLGPQGTLTNSGSIIGGAGSTAALGGRGVHMEDGGVATNQALGVIVGSVGLYCDNTGSATVINYGVIDGLLGVSVSLNAVADRLVVKAGSSLIGQAKGGGGLLELSGGSDTVTGLGGAGALTGSITGGFSQFGAYAVDASTIASLTGSNALSSKQSLTIASGGVVDLQGSLSNAGQILISGVTSAADLIVLAAGATLGGGGTVTLAGAYSAITGAAATATLTNINDVLVGQGALGAGKMTLVNAAAGVIEATTGKLVVNTGAATVTNNGLIESQTGGTLDLYHATINQSGGGWILANGGVVDLQDDTVLGGTVASTGTASVDVTASGGELKAVTVNGVAKVLNGVTLTLDGAMNIVGQLKVVGTTKATTLMVGPDGATLSGGGTIGLTSNVDNIIVGQVAADTLTNVNDHIVGGGFLGHGSMTLSNQAGGVIDGNAKVALVIDTGATAVLNAGLIEAVGGGGVSIASAVVNTGVLYADGGNLTLNGPVTGAGVGEINGGTLYAVTAFSENVTFTGTTGVLELAQSQAYTGAVTGLSAAGTNSLDLLDIAYAAKTTTASFSGTANSGTLTVTDGTHTAKINLVGNYLGSTFILSKDGHGGVRVVDPGAGVTAPPTRFITAMASMSQSSAMAGAPVVRAPTLHDQALVSPHPMAG